MKATRKAMMRKNLHEEETMAHKSGTDENTTLYDSETTRLFKYIRYLCATL